MFLDANIFIYAFAGEGERQSRASKKLVGKIATGEQRATTSVLAVEEVLHFFLEKKGKAFAFRVLGNILENQNITIFPLDERTLSLAPGFIEAGLGPADALHAATMKANGEATICSYDKGFDMAPGIRRKEP
ncbi:MAG: type II toxin-antitoxin system VapC family toxin [Candidatus Micrarchaeia archaeon]